MNLFITSSRGVYKYNLKIDDISQIISNWNKGMFKNLAKVLVFVLINQKRNHFTSVKI